jgi:hypothetical protein
VLEAHVGNVEGHEACNGEGCKPGDADDGACRPVGARGAQEL